MEKQPDGKKRKCTQINICFHTAAIKGKNNHAMMVTIAEAAVCLLASVSSQACSGALKTGFWLQFCSRWAKSAIFWRPVQMFWDN